MESMQTVLVVINKNAGSAKRINFEKVKECLGKDKKYTCVYFPCKQIEKIEEYDEIAVCGGDGTLSSIMQKAWDKNVSVHYFPVGTLNDKAKADRYSHAKRDCNDRKKGKIVVGKCACEKTKKEDIFTYVFACGSFTPIGYTSKVENKKKFGTLAYISHVFEEYKPHYIDAKIFAQSKEYEGVFTLIMFLKSPRCFGFPFNKAYAPKRESGHLVAIHSPKHKNALGYIAMFFPFFRVFFVGLRKEIESKNIIFKEVDKVDLTLKEDAVFCKDGEKLVLDKGKYHIDFAKSKCDFCVIEKF